MSAYLLPALIIGYVIFEVIEHVLLPLLWSFGARKGKALCGKEAMLNKLVEVKSWQDGTGLVLVDGELWKATSEDPLQSGDRATIAMVDGLVLKVSPFPVVGEGISNR